MASCLLLQPTGFVTKNLHSGVHRRPPGPHARDHLGRIRGLRCRTPRVQRRGRTFTCWSTPKYEMSGIHRFGMLLSAVLGPAAIGGSPGAAETTCYPLVLLGEWLADHAGRVAGADGIRGSGAGRTPA